METTNKKNKRLQLNKEMISKLNNTEHSLIEGGAPPVGPTITIECPADTMINFFTIGACCDINTFSDEGCGNFTRGRTCPSCI